MQPKIDNLNDQLQDLRKKMPQECLVNVGASMGTPQSMYKPVDPLVVRSSCQSMDPYPFTLIESPTPCRLALCTGEDTIKVVARGIVYPTRFDTVVHKQIVLPNHVKVSVDHVIVEGGETFLLPVPTQHYTHIGDVIGSFVQWPIHLVGIGEEDIVMKPKVENKYDCDSNVFYHTNVRSIFVMMDNNKDLLTMKWLDVSIIQVFIMYLHSNQFGTDSVGFLCPTQIAKATLDFNFNVVTAYIANVMVTMKDKTLILAPYHQSAFQSYMNQQGQRAKNLFNFKHVKCPQQPGDSECGYYVMKYMHELCTKYSTFTSLGE